MSDDTKPTEPLSEARLEELRALREVPWPTWFDTYGTGVYLLDGRPGAPHRCLASIDAEDDDNEDEARPLTRAYGKALVAHSALLAEVDRLKAALAGAEGERDRARAIATLYGPPTATHEFCGAGRRGPHAALVEELGRELARETSARWWLGQRGERPTALAAALGWPALVVEAMGTAYAGDLPFARSRAVTAWLAGGGTSEPAEIREAAVQLALGAAAAAAERRDKGWTR